MTVGELIKMSPEEKATFYDRVQENNKTATINTETDSIDNIVAAYVASEIPLDDMADLQQDLIAIGA